MMDLDMDFERAAKKLEKERRERQRKIQREKEKQQMIEMEAKKQAEIIKEKAEKRRLERLKAEQERIKVEEMNQGVKVEQNLKATPLVKADTNRVRLPKSFLESLERQHALDVVSGPLTFELVINGNIRTHCGVEEFTADEGQVCIPPSVALSLTRENGLDSLEGQQIRVRYVQLNHFNKVSVAFQPRGDGFHINDQEVVNIDIKTVLMRTLRDAITLTEGDWIPIRHDGITYELVVRKIEPEPALTIVNTDIEVDLMQSENVEKKEKEKLALEESLMKREKVIEAKKEILSQDTMADGDTVIRVRLFDGKLHTRSFQSIDKCSKLLDWVQTLLPTKDIPKNVVQSYDDAGEFYLIRNGSFGLAKIIISNQVGDQTLEHIGLGKRESLFVSWKVQEEEEEVIVENTKQQKSKNEDDQFSLAKKQAEQNLDEQITFQQIKQQNEKQNEEQQKLDNVDKVHVFQTLIAQGIENKKAAKAAQEYSSQISDLFNMGFSDANTMIPLLERYQGRLDRVVNLLAGGD